jgi:hypothetical protein
VEREQPGRVAGSEVTGGRRAPTWRVPGHRWLTRRELGRQWSEGVGSGSERCRRPRHGDWGGGCGTGSSQGPGVLETNAGSARGLVGCLTCCVADRRSEWLRPAAWDGSGRQAMAAAVHGRVRVEAWKILDLARGQAWARPCID